jgi:hypothetical protein
MIAVSNGHEDATRYLVSVNADLNAKENVRISTFTCVYKLFIHCFIIQDGHNTVLYAAEKGHLSILQYLVEECHVDINHSLTVS